MTKSLYIIIFLLISSVIHAQLLSLIPVSITGLPQLGNSKIAVADFDDDLDLDVFISGTDLGGFIQSGLYYNNGSFTFLDAGISIPKLINGDISIADFDKDNAIDIVISGDNANGKTRTYLYRNNKNGTFSPVVTPFVQLSNSSSVWLDIENDGDMDFIISGKDSNSLLKMELYINNLTLGFSTITSTGITAFYSGSLAVGDFNRDGYPDLIVSGINASSRFSDVYIGDGKGKFLPQNYNLPKVAFSKISVVDFDSDGYQDFSIQGANQTNIQETKIYRNNQGLAFVPLTTPITPTDVGTFSCADVNNDGSPDIFSTGRTNGNDKMTELFTFSGANSFAISSSNIVATSFSDAQWADFDNDLDVDLIVSGFSSGGPITYIYENNSTINNSIPMFAGVRQCIVSADSVKLGWAAFIDAQTPSEGLSYNIWVSIDKNTFSSFSTSTELTTGYNKANTLGKYNSTTSGWLKNFAEGKYYWRVQAIDASLKGSLFSPIDSFAVCTRISLGNDTAICLGKTISFSKGIGTDKVNWLVDDVGTVSRNSFTYVHTISGSKKVIVELARAYGCTLYDTILVDKIDLPVGLLPITFLQCFREPYTLSQAAITDTVYWYSKQSFLNKNQTFTGIALKKDTLTTTIISQYGCVNYDTITIDTLALPRFTLKDTSVCKFKSLEIVLQKKGTIQWYSTQLLSFIGTNYNISIIDTTYKLSAKITDSLGCYYADTMAITYYELPNANAGNDSIVCVNSQFELGEIEVATNGKSPYQYQWTLVADSLFSRPIIKITRDTTFRLKVVDANGCQATDTITITINPISVLDAGKSEAICTGDSIKLGGKPTAKNSLFGYTYNWSPINYTSSNPVTYPTSTTTYTLVVSSYECKPDTAYVTVTVNSLPITTVSADTVTIGNGDQISFSAYGGANYRWFPDTKISDKSAQSPYFYPDATTFYFVEVTDSKGCRNIDTVLVQVMNRFYIPTLFSPNNDGNNDEFHVYGTGVKELRLKIFDIYNQLVYESNDFQQIKSEGWNGEQNGKILPIGAYMWEISGSFYDEKPIAYQGKVRGIVNLIR